jgi:hypothetical protein
LADNELKVFFVEVDTERSAKAAPKQLQPTEKCKIPVRFEKTEAKKACVRVID